jgi:hypothetical protein
MSLNQVCLKPLNIFSDYKIFHSSSSNGFRFRAIMFVMLVLSSSVKDGVLRERDFQALCARVCFVMFFLRFNSRSLLTLAVCNLWSVYWDSYPVKTSEVNHD